MASDDFDSGRKVGDYEILARLSVGGMAELYLAFLPGPGGFKKFVALKQILPDVRNDEQFVKMFLDEARITSGLTHPNIAQVFDLGSDPGSGELYLAMEFIAGQNLSAVRKAAMRAGVVMPVPVACRIARDLCLALQAAHTYVDPAGHALSIVHRDVSPKNVMVSYAGHVKVVDFGIAQAKGRLVRTQAGQLRGTLSYMAPEQLEEKPVDGRTDLYAVGILLLELLTGQRRTSVDTPQAALKLARTLPENPSLSFPAISASLGAVVLQALAPAPAGRFQTGKAFARALESACPGMADEDEVAAFIGELFAPQLVSSRALFDAAQQDADPEQLSGLVERLAALSSAEPAAEEPAPDESQRATVVPAETAKVPVHRKRSSGAGLIAGLFVAGVLGALAVLGFLAESDRAKPIAPVELPAVPLRQPSVTLALQRAEAAMAAKNYAEAYLAWEEVLSAEHTNWPALVGAGLAARQVEKFEPAKAHLEQALELSRNPGDAAMVHFELGCVRARLGDAAGAMENLQQAVDLVGLEQFAGNLRTDKDLESLRTNADFQRLTGRAAAPTTKKPPSTTAAPLPGTGKTLLAEALALIRAEDDEGAIARLEQCVKVDSRAAGCFLSLGSTYARVSGRTGSARDRARSRKAYQRYLEVAPPGDSFVPRVRKILEESPP